MAFKLEKIKDELAEMYKNGKSYYQIAKEIGENEQAVSNIIRSVTGETPKKRKHAIDNTYFSKIDSVDKAYYFGLIAADGAIVYGKHDEEDNPIGSPSMTISLQVEDKYILDHLKESTSYEGEIKTYNQSYQKRGYCYEQARFVVMDKAFCSGLIEKGISERKSKTLGRILLNVEKEFQRDAIRGFFDGNGSVITTVTSGTKEKQYVLIRGNKDFLEELQELISPIASKCTIRWDKGSTEGSGGWGLRFGGKQVNDFRDLMYHDNMGKYFLIRKRNKFFW